MYFKSLELLGFKSFAEKTKLNFEPGVTAIVGPNGTGKSNVADAIRWVLGEQSAKSLRASNMQDVIFNGTDTKEPINFAEVSLTFSNEKRVLPIDYDEVTITRRVFRSGDTEYLLNKTPVRLKDISELLMGTGIGTESYSIIEQGKMDLILSSRPEDRRFVFEEASGITKFKSKKKEALRKLEQTEQNILRINDIIQEVKRQISSIERQARKAERYKLDYDRLKDMEVKLTSREYKSLKTEEMTLSVENNDCRTREGELGSEIKSIATTISAYRESLDEVNQKILDLKDRYKEMSGSLDMNTQKISIDKERIEEARVLQEGLKKEIGQAAEKMKAVRTLVEKLKSDLADIASARAAKQKSLEEKNILLSDLSEYIDETETRVKACKVEIVDHLSKETRIKNELIKIGADVQNRRARQRRLGIEKETVARELESVEAVLGTIAKDFKDREDRVAVVSAELESKRGANDRLSAEIKSLEERIVWSDSRKVAIKAKIEILEELIEECMKCAGGHAIESSLLNRKKRLEGLKEELCKTEADITGLCAERDRKAKEPKTTEADIGELEKKLHDEDIVLANVRSKKDTQEEAAKKLGDELELLGSELGEAASTIEELTKKGEALNAELNNIEKEKAASQGFIDSSLDSISQKRSEREKAALDMATLTAEKLSLEKEEDGIANSLKSQEGALFELEETLYQKEALLKESVEKEKFLKEEIAALAAENEKIQGAFLDFNAESSATEQAKSGLIDKLSVGEAQLKEKERAIEGLRNQIRDMDVKLTELNYKKTNLSQRISQAYKVDLETEHVEIEEDADWETIRSQVGELKEKLERMGPVNLVAIDEHKELEERCSFLTHQHEDLLNAKDSLHKAIQKINKTTKDLFVETFQKIQVEFKNFFRLLFGGGQAELVLIDEEDILESGIEIIVRPPGKKLQNLMLLSGGEKAMTATALLFAIFKVKPSPFCVLDEIDAPLDESNVTRFSNVLKEFLKISQFIIITHNKRTIELADVMYGITMQERGVSKIVSVKFSDELKKKTENNERSGTIVEDTAQAAPVS
ncbi:MAG: AAA family ATPase [Candidatus Omnitrophota bacterium]